MSIKHWWNDIVRGKQNTRRKTFPNAVSSTKNLTWTDLRPRPGIRGESPATSRPSRGTIKRYRHPCTGLDRPWGFQEIEVPRFQDNRHMKVVGLSALRTFTPPPSRKYSWYSVLLEAESTTGPKYCLKNYVSEKFQWHHLESNPRPCSAVPQPTAPSRTPRSHDTNTHKYSFSFSFLFLSRTYQRTPRHKAHCATLPICTAVTDVQATCKYCCTAFRCHLRCQETINTVLVIST